MRALLIKLGSAVLALGTIVGTAAPSFADNCFGFYHPARAEVLRRDARLNREINHDYGFLRGHFGQLKAEDRAIFRQEQMDAWRNGGYITPGQYRQLNHEENGLQRQINYDHRWL
jgi:hypothetical protein